MLRVMILLWGWWALLQRMLVAHLAVINEGSPTPDRALVITDATIAQAFYSRLTHGATDHYRFEMPPETLLVMSMLVPERFLADGFCPLITLYGPGLPPKGFTPEQGNHGTRDGSTIYQRIQRERLTLDGGRYRITIQGTGEGVYCFCVGNREAEELADAETKARVQALLAS
ncbi:MAG: hypothetical protein GFH27_549297n304 [Chloroflexi bacterium AL-W]|nr:hypothetical protein [Chloroflexi bacterium AL-N1]NOK68843.1 hypothetical protein [Chloroflexi bacterium AL-N10]NOK76827.1 hypothetical protein [Chloroflexi bacterium AL-N5]NOK82786.1 hypothetical protein [Chloroflexi bacterium AL-W]NOK90684.1 hypothetical protein [Chloroflexi bacterium AL-N15]